MQGDPMREKTYAYADFNLGHAFPETHYTVASHDNDAFLSTVRHGVVRSQEGQDCAEHADPVPRPIHPTLLGSYQPQHAVFSWPTGVLHAKESVVMLTPAFPDEALVSTVTVQDLFERNGKKFVVLRITIDKAEPRTPAMVVQRTLVWPH
jgi:hypothetical protein